LSVVLVTGGTGVLGRALLPMLRDRGHEVRVLSRRSGAGTHMGDLTTGEGLAAAAAGADLVVHAASDTRRFGRTDVQQTRNLLGVVGGTRHLLYTSIVGIDRIPYRYYRKKLACEYEIERSNIAHTILRATQFHELVAMVLGPVERIGVAALPLDFKFQPVAAADVADNVAHLLEGPPVGHAADFGGPEVLTVRELAEAWRDRRGRPRFLAHLPIPGRVAAGFRHGLNTSPEHSSGRYRWEQFVDALPPRGARAKPE